MNAPHFPAANDSRELPYFSCPACGAEARPEVSFPWWFCPACHVRLIPADLGPHDYRRSAPPLFSPEPQFFRETEFAPEASASKPY